MGTTVSGCGAPAGGHGVDGVDVTKESVIQGVVSRAGEPLPGAFVRLLDRDGEFTAEVQTSEAGSFRFFAAPGDWTLRVLAPSLPPTDQAVAAAQGQVAEASIDL
jgi:hypothetical protein